MTTRILIVDDAADVRRLLGAIIATHGSDWQVVGEASDGEQAVNVALELVPDLILVDLAMPIMDGLQAIPLLRAAAPGAAVVVLTGFPDSAALDQARAAGAHGYLTKDDLVATLVPRLTTILDEHAGGRSTREGG